MVTQGGVISGSFGKHSYFCIGSHKSSSGVHSSYPFSKKNNSNWSKYKKEPTSILRLQNNDSKEAKIIMMQKDNQQDNAKTNKLKCN